MRSSKKSQLFQMKSEAKTVNTKSKYSIKSKKTVEIRLSQKSQNQNKTDKKFITPT